MKMLTTSHPPGFKLAASVLAGLTLVGLAPAPVLAFEVTVTTTADSGTGSLRAAIAGANAFPWDTDIAFRIPTTDPGFSDGVFTIRPATPLPPLLNLGTSIDGSTQRFFTGNTNAAGPEVVLNGSLAGSSNGIVLGTPSCLVNGLVINGFTLSGVVISSGAERTQVWSCYIGTDASGTGAVANGTGVLIQDGISDIDRCLISGNTGDGVAIADARGSNKIHRCMIGTAADGITALGNGGNGVSIKGSKNNRIGYTVGGVLADVDSRAYKEFENIIAFNKKNGVYVADGRGSQHATANTIVGNAIFSNGELGGLGIDLVDRRTIIGLNSGSLRVTYNDDGSCISPGDSDTGPNHLQNFPVLTSAVSTPSRTSGNILVLARTTIQGTLNSTPNARFLIQFFTSVKPSASGYGEGQRYVGQKELLLTSCGVKDFSFSIFGVYGSQYVTATATKIDSPTGSDPDSIGDTSEFSKALLISSGRTCKDVLQDISDIEAHLIDIKLTLGSGEKPPQIAQLIDSLEKRLTDLREEARRKGCK